ncbi:A24 family peptidase C-terminal domain-containing protein [Thermococcus sp.]
MQELLLIILGIVMGILTSYTDLKTGFIDDLHVFPFAAAGIIYYLYEGLFVKHNTFLAFSGVMGFAAGLLLGLLLYFLGGWASGDVVILAGFSALFPYASSYARIAAPYSVNYPLHAVTLMLNSIIAIFPVVFIYATGVIVIRRKTGELREILFSRANLSVEVALWIMGAMGITLILENVSGAAINTAIRYVLTVILIFILGKRRRVGDAIGAASVVYMTYSYGTAAITAFIRLLVVLYLFKVFLSVVSFMRREVLVEEKPVEDIEEWDILGEWLYEMDGKIFRDREGFFDKLKRAVSEGNLSHLMPKYENVIASPTAEGLTREQIEKLRRLVEEGRLENRFLVKKSMPFAPALFLGFLISVFYGDLFWWISLKMSGL